MSQSYCGRDEATVLTEHCRKQWTTNDRVRPQMAVPCPDQEKQLRCRLPQPTNSNWRRAITLASIIAATVSLLTTTSYMAAPNTGAIFTTGSTCDGTNINIFNSKSDVYVDGGPAHEGAAGLPDGFYYVQVTEPGGALLGTSVGSANGRTC